MNRALFPTLRSVRSLFTPRWSRVARALPLSVMLTFAQATGSGVLAQTSGSGAGSNAAPVAFPANPSQVDLAEPGGNEDLAVDGVQANGLQLMLVGRSNLWSIFALGVLGPSGQPLESVTVTGQDCSQRFSNVTIVGMRWPAGTPQTVVNLAAAATNAATCTQPGQSTAWTQATNPDDGAVPTSVPSVSDIPS